MNPYNFSGLIQDFWSDTITLNRAKIKCLYILKSLWIINHLMYAQVKYHDTSITFFGTMLTFSTHNLLIWVLKDTHRLCAADSWCVKQLIFFKSLFLNLLHTIKKSCKFKQCFVSDLLQRDVRACWPVGFGSICSALIRESHTFRLDNEHESLRGSRPTRRLDSFAFFAHSLPLNTTHHSR